MNSFGWFKISFIINLLIEVVDHVFAVEKFVEDTFENVVLVIDGLILLAKNEDKRMKF